MIPAQTSQRLKEKSKLLAIHGAGRIEHKMVADLGDHFNPGDVLIINRSATLPSSFRGILRRTGEPVEIRMAAFEGTSVTDLRDWSAFTFGEGDWRVPTESRGAPPTLLSGDQIFFGAGLSATVSKVERDRWIHIRFAGERLEHALYQYGRPIQYSYLNEELEVWDQQTIFAGPPISVEPPSASFPLTWDLIFRLQANGVRIASLVHGAGISSTGSPELDRLLPLEEWYEIPAATAAEFRNARENGKRIIAAGTTVLRALESAFDGQVLRSGSGQTTLRIKPGDQVRSAQAIITGMHDLGTSHLDILGAFREPALIRAGYLEAAALGYRGHEYGDLAYISA